MAQIGDQRHSRPGLRRHISIADISSPRNRQGVIKNKTNAIAVAFVVLIVVLFLVVTFGRTTSVKAASASPAGNHHPGENGKGFTVDMTLSPQQSVTQMQLRDSEKGDKTRGSMDSSSESRENAIIKARLNSREGIREVDVDSIAQRTDAALKAAEAAVEAERAAVAAVKEEDENSVGADWMGERWDVSTVKAQNV